LSSYLSHLIISLPHSVVVHLLDHSFFSLSHSSHSSINHQNHQTHQFNFAIMQFTTNLFLSLALALSASAAPLIADSAPVVSDANVLEKRDSVSCQRRGPAVRHSIID
jgi:hypothetical protein